MVGKAVHCLFVSLSTHSLNHIECFASFSVSFYTNRFIDMQESSNILTLSTNSALAYQCFYQCFLLFYTNHSNENFIYNLFCLFVDFCCLFNIDNNELPLLILQYILVYICQLCSVFPKSYMISFQGYQFIFHLALLSQSLVTPYNSY